MKTAVGEDIETRRTGDDLRPANTGISVTLERDETFQTEASTETNFSRPTSRPQDRVEVDTEILVTRLSSNV